MRWTFGRENWLISHGGLLSHGGSPKLWMVKKFMENPIQMDDFGVIWFMEPKWPVYSLKFLRRFVRQLWTFLAQVSPGTWFSRDPVLGWEKPSWMPEKLWGWDIFDLADFSDFDWVCTVCVFAGFSNKRHKQTHHVQPRFYRFLIFFGSIHLLSENTQIKDCWIATSSPATNKAG